VEASVQAVTRKQAKELGLRKYFTGAACPHGHIAERLVSNGTCVVCASVYIERVKTEKKEQYQARRKLWYLANAEKVRENVRKWREDNPERVKENAKRGYVKNKRRWMELQKTRYATSPEARRSKIEANTRYAEKNREAIRESGRLRYHNHKDKYREYRQQYYRENRHLFRAQWSRYRAARRTPKWADLNKIAEIYKLAGDLSQASGVKHHVDHIIPLRGDGVCGLHVENNLRVVPAEVNLSKGNKFDPLG
jgi:hypothetical protein